MANDYPSMAVDNKGDIVIRASALGGCYRALVAEALGYVKEPVATYISNAFREGINREPIILSRLQNEYKVKLLVPPKSDNNQHQFTWEVVPGVTLRGSMDGIGVYKGKTYVVEVKTATEESFKYFEKNQLNKPKIPTYPWQASVYYHATKRDIPNLAGILYVVQMKRKDPQTDPILTFIIDTPPYSISDIESRVVILKKYYEMSKSSADELLPPCSKSSWCNFRYLHDDGEEPVLDLEGEISNSGGGVSIGVIDPDLARYAKLSEEAKAIEKSMDELKKIIIERYKDDPRREKGIISAGYKFSLAKVESTVFAKDAAIDKLREIGESIDSYYSKGKSYYRFTPTKIKNGVNNV